MSGRIGWLGVVLAVVGLAMLRPRLAEHWPRPVAPRVPEPSGIRIASWNLRNFPSSEQDLAQIAHTLERLDADVLALQEIRDPERLRELLPDYEVWASHGGGRGGQHVAIAVNPRRTEALGGTHEVDALTLGGRVRPGLWLRLRDRTTDARFVVFVVHLKATPAGYIQRHFQWLELAQAVRAIPEQALVVLGDFNTTGGPDASDRDERQALADVLAMVDLRTIATDLPCTAYWQGSRFDSFYEPTTLDGLWVRGLPGSAIAHLAGACGRHRCQAIESSEGYPDLDLGAGSDHCPIWWDLGHPAAPTD